MRRFYGFLFFFFQAINMEKKENRITYGDVCYCTLRVSFVLSVVAFYYTHFAIRCYVTNDIMVKVMKR